MKTLSAPKKGQSIERDAEGFPVEFQPFKLICSTDTCAAQLLVDDPKDLVYEASHGDWDFVPADARLYFTISVSCPHCETPITVEEFFSLGNPEFLRSKAKRLHADISAAARRQAFNRWTREYSSEEYIPVVNSIERDMASQHPLGYWVGSDREWRKLRSRLVGDAETFATVAENTEAAAAEVTASAKRKLEEALGDPSKELSPEARELGNSILESLS